MNILHSHCILFNQTSGDCLNSAFGDKEMINICTGIVWHNFLRLFLAIVIVIVIFTACCCCGACMEKLHLKPHYERIIKKLRKENTRLTEEAKKDK